MDDILEVLNHLLSLETAPGKSGFIKVRRDILERAVQEILVLRLERKELKEGTGEEDQAAQALADEFCDLRESIEDLEGQLEREAERQDKRHTCRVAEIVALEGRIVALEKKGGRQ